jgi:hypothetical protein
MGWLKWAKAQWDRVGAVVALGGSLLALYLGWLGVSDSVYPAQALPYVVSGGFVALVLIGVSGILWLSADLRDEWRKMDRLEDAWRASSSPGASAAAGNERLEMVGPR